MNYFYFHSFLIFVFFTNVNSNIHSHSVLKYFEKIQVSHIQSLLPFNHVKLENNSSFFERVLLMNNNVNLYVNDLKTGKKECLNDLWYILKNLKSHRSIQMLDASGKLPSGVLLGNLLWIGKYDECSNVYVPKMRNETLGFHGIYCMAQWNISMPNKINVPMQQVPIKTGVCLPSSCQSMDVKTDIIHIFSALYSLPIIEHYDGDVKLTSLKCQSNSSPLNFSAVLFISVLGIYLSLPVIGSLITAIQYFYKYIEHSFSSKMLLSSVASPSAFTPEEEFPIYLENEECEDDQVSLSDDKIQNITNLSNWTVISTLDKVLRPLKCFCIFSNAVQILNTDTTKKQFPCLHGLRFFSMTWVILGHTYVHNINYIDNYLDLLKGIDSLPFQAVMQGTFSVDSFFLIGGFLLGYLYLEEADKRDGKINWLGLCIHRFLRITPVYVFLIGFSALLFKYLGYGPFWEEADDVATCNQYWWWNVLYINNFLPINSMCLDWTWYLANDMQFFVLSSLILYVLWRWKYVGIGIFCSLLLGSWICTGYLSYIYDIPPLFMGITEVKNYTEYQGKLILAWDILYSKPYCRIGPHIIGILLAYLMHHNMHKKFTMSTGMQVIGWCLATFCSGSVIYGLYHVKPSSSLLHLYNALGRSSFSFGVGWLIFCCLTGQGGFINTFLSYKLWIPLSRLTFCAYLFHPLVMNWYFQVQQVPLFFSHSTMVALFISFLFISYGVAFVISIIFEAPLINLEKIIYKR